MRQIFLDLETTGLDPVEHRVVEVAAYSYIDRRQEDDGFHRYCDPQRDVEEDAFRIHGLARDFLREHPLFESFAADLQEFLRGGEVIIHNANFDTQFLDVEFAKCNLPPLADIAAKITCSLELARYKFPDMRRHRLVDLCSRFGVDDSARVQHSASLDTQLLAQVFFAMHREQMPMEMPSGKQEHVAVAACPVLHLAASADENAAHEQFLQDMEEQSGVPSLWRKFGES